MLITVQEAARALAAHPKTIIRHYTGDMVTQSKSGNIVIESEFLAAAFGCDHRFIMAWLGEYDWALSSKEVGKYVGKRYHRHVYKTYKPVLSVYSFARYSAREVAFAFAKKEAANGATSHRKKNRLATLLPPPNTLPPSNWGFRSIVDERGAGLPRAGSSSLKQRPESSLPVLTRSGEWYR